MRYYSCKKNRKIYIISGKFKGRKISFDYSQYLRPTTNQIRETIFNWLSKHIKNARCLDCFSGSGVLGIEAISHSAAFATLLEINKKAIFNIKKNIQKLNIDNLEIIHTNTLNWLKKSGKLYEIVFLDPPYYQKLIQKTIYLLEKNKWIKKNSLIYIEKNKKTPLILPNNWILYKQKITRYIECSIYSIKT